MKFPGARYELSAAAVRSRLRELDKAGILTVGDFSSEAIGDHYDRFAAINRRSGPYMNFGLWAEDTCSHSSACENLVRTLVDSIECRDGKVLDAACGLGATTKCLARYWPSSDIVGINLTPAQIEVCRRTAPDCRFAVMDATSLEFDGGAFGNIFCIEAAQHFRTRGKFLREAIRVLSPGGTLVMTDLLVHEEAIRTSKMFPVENYLRSEADYHDLLLEVGFREVEVADITASGWLSYANFVVRDSHEKWFSGEISFASLRDRLSFVYAGIGIFAQNLLIVARKPART